MLWLLILTSLLLICIVIAVVAVNAARFERRVAAEMRALASHARSPGSSQAARESLPAPVARYLALAIGADHSPVSTVRLRYRGTFRPRPEQRWLPIHGTQLLTTDPPSFIWWGRVGVAPGLWMDGYDKLVGGVASMQIRAESTLTLGESKGPELDQGAAIRVLAEMVWFPAAFLDDRYVTWSEIDDRSARATLRIGDHQVSAVFHFGPDGLPVRVSANRYRDVNGKGVLTPWYGSITDYRTVAGLRVPFAIEVVWELEGGPFPCIRFTVEDIEIERWKPVFEAPLRAPAGITEPPR
jgi:hypothetical protein